MLLQQCLPCNLLAWRHIQTVQGEWHQWAGYLESWTPPYGAFALKASVLSSNYTGDDHREIRYSVAVVSIGSLIRSRPWLFPTQRIWVG